MTKTTESFDVIMSFPYLEFWGHFITYKTDPKFFKEAHKVLQALAWVHIPTLHLPAMCQQCALQQFSCLLCLIFFQCKKGIIII